MFVLKNYPCFLRGRSGHVCRGEAHPHHAPYKSANPGSWTDRKILHLCEAGHTWVHKNPKEFKALASQSEIERQQEQQVEDFIASLVEAGPPLIVDRPRKKSTRRNRQKFQGFIPLENRT